MQRREFIQLASSAAFFSTFGLPRPANADITLATISSGFSLASGVMGFLSRGSDPTVPLLISLSDMVTALGLKIDAIDQKLDLLISELAELRKLVESLPTDVALLSLTLDLREPWNGFVELGGKEPPIRPSNHYLNELPRTYRRLQIARRKFMDLSLDRARAVYDGAVELSLAQDAEITLAEEMLRPELFEMGQALDLSAHRRALQEYEKFFVRALDPAEPNSLRSLKSMEEAKVRRLLGVASDADLSPLPAEDDARLLRPESYYDFLILGSRRVSLNCVRLVWVCVPGVDIIDGRTGFCSKPTGVGENPYTDGGLLTYSRQPVPDSLGIELDSLGLPYLFSIYEVPQCSGGVYDDAYPKPHEAELERLNPVNRAIANYYRLHWAEEISALALEINRKLQADISELIGV